MSLFGYDQELRQAHSILCGVDEAGRGPLAGPVFAAAVILPPDFALQGLDDSKKLSAKKRESLLEPIQSGALAWAIAQASVAEIEAINILQAALLAMSRAVKDLSITPNLVLFDGNKLPDCALPARAVVGGDRTSASIAAASILAKVARDRAMVELANKYPAYHFEKHKGYGTELHYQALREHGPCPVHRPAFLRSLYQEGKR
ncbi:MAG: ribonuclease HII [Oscillospiraceae bacterium]|nr:ribonuclease HII [Oscillospiraceae bacterium]